MKEEDGGKKSYKDTIVVKVFAYKKGIDFDEKNYPIFKMTLIKTILSIMAIEDSSWTVRCKENFSPWGFGGRDLFVATIGVWSQMEG